MSLKKTIVAHDDAALEGLTSKGVLRRAHREFDKSNGEVLSADSKQAEVLADGQTVAIDGRGPTAATCTCPAAGVCRHIVLAVLLLRDTSGEQEQSTVSAQEELCKVTEAQLQKFAGADWDKAITIATSDEAVELSEVGHSLVVTFSELDASITFIAGQGLRQAAYKGPRTRQRLLTVVAVMAVRERAGVEAPEAALTESASRPAVSDDFIDDAQLVIQRAVAAIIPGRSEIAFDMLLDLAISTRAEALPRLSAEARGLANLARLSQSRDVAFEAEVFLRRAARTYALCEGLRRRGDDLVLTGTIKRDYQPRSNLMLWLLGIARWRSIAGARGATCYGYAPEEKRWFTVSDGRASGADPGFSVDSVYDNSLWGGGPVRKLVGWQLELTEPSAAADGSLSLHVFSKPAKAHARVTTSQLFEADAAFDNWRALHDSLAENLGSGLRRRVSPLPVVIVPKRFRGFGFNDLDQVYELEIADSKGDTIILSIPGEEHDTARRIKQNARKIKALLIEVSVSANGLSYRPVTAFLDEKSSIACVNVDFDEWPYRIGQKAIGKIGDLLIGSREPATRMIDPLAAICSDVIEALVGKVGRSTMVEMEKLRLRAESAGLVALATALKGVQIDDSVESALKAAYVTTEIENLLLMA